MFMRLMLQAAPLAVLVGEVLLAQGIQRVLVVQTVPVTALEATMLV